MVKLPFSISSMMKGWNKGIFNLNQRRLPCLVFSFPG